MRKASLALGVVAVLVVSSWTGSASAQTGPAADEVDPTAKGIIGCTLLGAEAALLVESAIGVRNGWALGLIPLATGIGGGVGGYFLEQNADAEWSVAMLVAGMALVIPTTIIVLKSTAYTSELEEGWVDRSEEEQEPEPTTGGPDTEETSVERTTEEPPPPSTEQPAPPPEGGGGTEAPPSGGGTTPPGPQSLLQLRPGTLAIGLPAFGLVPSYSTDEVRRFGLTQRSELRVSLLSAQF